MYPSTRIQALAILTICFLSFVMLSSITYTFTGNKECFAEFAKIHLSILVYKWIDISINKK